MEIEDKIKIVNRITQYGIIYQKLISEEIFISKSDLNELKDNLLYKIPKEIISNIELFCRLDKEFKDIYGNINADEFNKNYNKLEHNPNWRGYWLNAVGNELSLFINWLKDCIKQDIEYIEIIYLRQNNRFGAKRVPYSVKIAHNIYNKYFKNKVVF